MTNHHNTTQPAGRAAGWLLLLTSALTVIGMANHPESFAEFAAAGGPLHGLMIAGAILAFAAFARFAQQRDLRRFPVLVGLVCLAFGTMVNVLAGLINGFAVPALLMDGAADKAVLAFAWELNQVFAQSAVFLSGSAFFLWGADMTLSEKGMGRLAGVLGALTGLVPVGLIAVGLIGMQGVGALAAYSIQAAFGLVAAWTLLRN